MTTATEKRLIIEINEDLCDGCGQCIIGCAEGALAIVDGKARLVGDALCDGLGACLGECPRGALTLIEREAPPFDEALVEARLEELGRKPHAPTGCPGAAAQQLQPAATTTGRDGSATASALGHWPVKLRLMNPEKPPFPKGATLLLAADCVPVAHPALHADLLPGKAVAIACPKFEEQQATLEKLIQLFTAAEPSQVVAARMEVPCCTGLSTLAHQAAEAAARQGVRVEVVDKVVTRDGRLVDPAPTLRTL